MYNCNSFLPTKWQINKQIATKNRLSEKKKAQIDQTTEVLRLITWNMSSFDKSPSSFWNYYRSMFVSSLTPKKQPLMMTLFHAR